MMNAAARPVLTVGASRRGAGLPTVPARAHRVPAVGEILNDTLCELTILGGQVVYDRSAG